MRRAERVAAAALDLGSTRIKAGLLDPEGGLSGIEEVAAPPLAGEGPVREGDAEDYLGAARGLVRRVAAGLPAGTPLGIATQRSTFVLWHRASGRPARPMVSWQDRRAAEWCVQNCRLEPEIVRRTGLLLSAHYAGPKLAAMQRTDEGLRRALADGDHRFGTLETFLVWRWTAGQVHETDVSVAARTALVDLATLDWSDELLRSFSVPRALLPTIVPTRGRSHALDVGLALAATVADQAAGALALLDEDGGAALVNLGTGTFVLRATREAACRRPGYLAAPILAEGARARYSLEGTINGSGPALDRFGAAAVVLPDADPAPGAFAIPDASGLGSPHWRPEIGLTLSPEAERLDDTGRRRTVAEGLLFRIASIVADLFDEAPPARVLVAGGSARDPEIPAGLATLLGRPVELLADLESGLIGAARLAAGLPPNAAARTVRIDPGRGRYLPGKLARWREWLALQLGR